MHTATANKPRRQIRGRDVWEQLINAQPGSGLSVEAYCRLHKLSPSGFYTWRTRLGKKTVSGRGARAQAQPLSMPLPLVDLGTLSAASSPSWDIEVDLGAGIVLRLRRR